MDKIRIGKDIYINWQLQASDQSVVLTQENLTLELTTPSGCIAELPFEFEAGTLTANFYGIDQKQLGRYWLTVWYKRNEIGQSALDKVLAFQLVRSTEDETHHDESIAYAEVNLSGTIDILAGGSGGGGVELEYYSENTQRHSATIDTGYASIDIQPDDDGYITLMSEHTSIYDNSGNGLTFGNQNIDGVESGVRVITAANKKFLWNNDEVAVKSDLTDFVDSSQLTAHTNNTAIHVTLEDKVKWDGKQDPINMDSSLDITSLNPVTNKAITTVIEENEHIWAEALNELDNKKQDKTFNFVSLTQADYDALTTKDSSTIYFITA